MRRADFARVAITALATVITLGAAPASARPAEPTVAWAACADQADVQCGSVTVPIDWSRPGGATLDIALARRPAGDPTARIGTLVINPGGPGGSGVAQVKGGIADHLPAEVRRRFDLVGFDPRGVADSSQMKCLPSGLTAAHYLPTTSAQFDQLRAGNKAASESCHEVSGPLAGFLDNLSVVRDIDAIRAAVGDRKLTFYGISYGSMMGQQYAQMFPGRVRALVLDSNMDHSRATTWDFLRSETVGAQQAFDRFVEWCATNDECALHGQDVRKVVAGLHTRAEAGELGETDPLTLLDEIQSMFAGPYWPELADRLTELTAMKPTQTAEPTRTGKPTQAGKAQAGKAQAGKAAEEAEPIEDIGGIFCSDWRLPVRDVAEVKALRTRLARVAPDMKLNTQAWVSVLGCVGHTAEVRNPQAPLKWTGVPPVLLLNSRYDAATPHEWARNVARQTGATLLTYEGAGHGVYSLGSPCTREATERYLISVRTPRPGSTCPAI
ncbi:alpha/beta hydrolase [Actinoplanes couchii]|uniref:Peptidase n=1 Tax=Actinoplanes couchii TaxID=403638 RepID=A0ABQ3XT22_9ACTN|nr:alpha/beta hydrolase [Actinoplanes couchii]MDR6319959.1 pimeloyl-ACP methyl ester carboxylesterase [Actinoplanes couchii]GID61659.1 peptidase [Actinoplanes couchii]